MKALMRRRPGCSRLNSVMHPKSLPNFTLPTLLSQDHGPLNPFRHHFHYTPCPNLYCFRTILLSPIPSKVLLNIPSYVLSSLVLLSVFLSLDRDRDRPELGTSHFTFHP